MSFQLDGQSKGKNTRGHLVHNLLSISDVYSGMLAA